MRELLIRYLLGELEPHEHDAVQAQLAASPELRGELSKLRACFANSCQDDEDFDDGPPRGLAERTAFRVAESDSYDTLPKLSTKASEGSEPPPGMLGWSLADLTVAGGVILAVSMLLFPALHDSRNAARRIVCQDKQRQIYTFVANFQGDHGSYIPYVQPNDIAGTYTAQLVQFGYVEPQVLIPLMICPDAEVADDISAKRFAVEIPTLEALDRMTPEERCEAGKRMSPTYAYGYGYRRGQQYFYIRGYSAIPFLGDEPGAAADGYMSQNHGGSIVQYTTLDGSVKTRTSCKIEGNADDLYVNSLGECAAGFGQLDSVLGLSESTPAVFIQNERQR